MTRRTHVIGSRAFAALVGTPNHIVAGYLEAP